jgi:hypothetical protein
VFYRKVDDDRRKGAKERSTNIKREEAQMVCMRRKRGRHGEVLKGERGRHLGSCERRTSF